MPKLLFDVRVDIRDLVGGGVGSAACPNTMSDSRARKPMHANIAYNLLEFIQIGPMPNKTRQNEKEFARFPTIRKNLDRGL